MTFRKLILATLVPTSLSLLAACGDDGSLDPDGGGPDGGGRDSGILTSVECPAGSLTICSLKVKNDPFHPGVDEPVSLTNVVVSTPIIQVTDMLQGFYVQDVAFSATENSKFAGIAVTFNPAELVGAVPGVGSVVNVDGVYREFGAMGATKKQSQIAATRVEATGASETLPIVTVAPGDIVTGGGLSDALEGSLVRVENVSVTEFNVTIGTSELFGSYRVTGNLIIWADRDLYQLERFWQNGETLTFVQGILRLGTTPFNAGASMLSPRSREDWNSTRIALSSIAQINDPATPAGCAQTAQGKTGTCHAVELTRVLVVAVGGYISPTLRSLWVQDPAAQGAGSGAKVVYNPENLTTPPNVGEYIDLSAELIVYFGMKQVQFPRITRNGTDTGEPQATTVANPADLAIASPAAAAWAGSLVRIENVAVTTACRTPRDFGAWIVTGNVLIGSSFDYDYNGMLCDGANCTCETNPRPNDQRMVGNQFQSITGVVDFSFDEYQIQPRNNADLVRMN